jgi:hypothetical protein
LQCPSLKHQRPSPACEWTRVERLRSKGDGRRRTARVLRAPMKKQRSWSSPTKNSLKKFYGRDRFQLSSTVGEGVVARTTKVARRLKGSPGILVEGRLSALWGNGQVSRPQRMGSEGCGGRAAVGQLSTMAVEGARGRRGQVCDGWSRELEGERR